jgi:hypothetical protein
LNLGTILLASHGGFLDVREHDGQITWYEAIRNVSWGDVPVASWLVKHLGVKMGNCHKTNENSVTGRKPRITKI